MAETEENAGAGAGDEITPYKIHVSSRYLELTRQKLELTRLPHEGKEPPSKDWWEPKPQVEQLIDFWLEKYSWRDQEETLNRTPQFRTAISIPGSETPLRLHFIHVPSPHGRALPLLLIPPFPLSNLALVHLVRVFTEPEDAAGGGQPFHLVIPALPGLGFSDPFPNNTPEVAATAESLNALMARLGYQHYLVSNSGPADSSPAEIDWRLVERLATRYPGSCVGAHLIAPPLASPKLSEAPIEWAKWTIANTLSAGILGYSKQDFSALKKRTAPKGSGKKGLTPSKLGLNDVGLREPNTLAYAMCDSPTGLLVFAMKGLSLLRPRMQLTPEQIITMTNLAWLPGPEYAMRFWAHCATDDEAKAKERKTTTNKPKVGITVFLGGKDEETGDASTAREASEGAIRLDAPPRKGETGAGYACPAWGKAHYNVLASQRITGKPGLLAWERPDVILTGVRGLAEEMLKVDKHLRPTPEAPTAALENVVVAGETEGAEAAEETETQDPGLKPPERPILEQGDSSRTQVGSPPPPSPKGKEPEAAPGAAASEDTPKPKDGDKTDSPREGTPDTIVLVTAPTGEEPAK